MYIVFPRIYKEINRILKIFRETQKEVGRGKWRAKKNRRNKEKNNNKMVDLNPNISITTLNINGLSKAIKREIVIMHKKQDLKMSAYKKLISNILI